MKVPHQPRRPLDASSMTPMIDIVFLLLIFFIITASGQISEALLPADLSAAGTVDSEVIVPELEPLALEIWLKLTVNAQGDTEVDMNGTTYRDMDKLKSQLLILAELGPENPVILDIASDVPFGDTVNVHDTCLAAHFDSISFAADAE